MRGFDLFDDLSEKLLASRSYVRKTKGITDDNKEIETFIIEESNYKQYERYQIIVSKMNSQAQKKLQLQNNLQLFTELEGRLFDSYKFGEKIGSKIEDNKIKWVEKWAEFIQENINHKYMCKFWYQLGNEIHFEIKFQKVNNNILEYENVEKGILIQSSRSNIDMIELMTFKIYFNSDEAKKYEKGLSQKISDDKINVLIEKWITDYENDIYEKEKYPRKINELKQDIQGEREGKNLHGQYWNERWYGSWDKKYQGWKKQTFEENESVRLELGESHDQTSEVSIRNEQWQEKLEKQNDYWENSWEQIISYDQNLQNCDLVREGKKSFKNNRSYIYQEEWKEYKSGEIKVVKFKDDGFGQKNHEYYSLFKKDDIIEYELKQGSIEDVSKNVKVEISQGKTFKGLYDEWNNERIVDFNQGFEKVSNTGKNHLGEWKETWGEQNNVKWAYKEGTNFFTSEQWKEEWYEKRSSQNEIEEHKVEKWGRNNQEEWNEKWGEVYNGDKKEKWADKWTVDIQSGYKRGVNWGHQLDEELKPKHHWVEQWDNNGTIVKRQENY